MRAREYFEGIRSTTFERDKTALQLKEIEDRLTAPSTPTIGGTSRQRTVRGIDDRLANVERRRSRLLKRLGKLDNEIMQAEGVLYDEGGLCDYLSDIYGDIVFARFFENLQWKQISKRFDLSVTTTRGMFNTALATIDEHGLIDRLCVA